MQQISVILPAYNEEKRIAEVLDDLTAYLKKNFRRYEVIVACNGCTDGTQKIAEGYFSEGVRPILASDVPAKGRAIQAGFAAAKGEIVGFLDSDSSISAEQFGSLVLALAERGADGAIASRYCKGAPPPAGQNFRRLFASRTFNLIVRLFFGLPFADTQCGAKVFRKGAIDSVNAELKTGGFSFDVELLWRLNGRGLKIIESPVTCRHCAGGKFSLLYAPAMLRELLVLRFG